KRRRVDEAARSVERRQDLLRGVPAPQPRDELRARAVRGQIGAPEEGMAAARARELVRELLRDEEVPAHRRGDLLLRELLLPREVGGLVLRGVLQEREEDARLEVAVRELLGREDRVRDEDSVVRDALEEDGRARAHREDRGLESDEAPHEEVLQVR